MLIDKANINKHDITAITPISEGLSQECLLIETKLTAYVVKRFNNTASFKTELSILALLKKGNLTAKLINSHQVENTSLILMTHLSGKSLKKSSITLLEKLSTATDLLAKFHDELRGYSAPEIQSLALEQVLLELLLSAKISPKYEQLVTKIIEKTIKNLSKFDVDELPKTICHGDFNFTNIIGDKPVKVIDFESASLMPIEYDIAMMMAINKCTLNELNHVISVYKNTTTYNIPSQEIDSKIVEQYYIASILINGLWFLSKSNETTKKEEFTDLAKAQFSLHESTKNILI